MSQLQSLEDYLEHSRCLVHICRRKERREGKEGSGEGKGGGRRKGWEVGEKEGGWEKEGEGIAFWPFLDNFI